MEVEENSELATYSVSIVSIFSSSVQISLIMLKTCLTEAFETGIETMCCKSSSKLGACSFFRHYYLRTALPCTKLINSQNS